MAANNRAQAPRARERNVNLRKYYGVESANAQPRPLDIDDATFDSAKYFVELLKEKRLDGLVARDNQLVTEIREIDGDMKTLVYENYSKFISATDTIRKMKSNVENMESEMGRLNESFSSISEQCNSIDEALGPNQIATRQLSRDQKVLRQLQLLRDLPSFLQTCLDEKRHTEALEVYSKASIVLTRHSSIPFFQNIKHTCDDLMELIRQQAVSEETKSIHA